MSSNDREPGFCERNWQALDRQLRHVRENNNRTGIPVYIQSGTWLLDRELRAEGKSTNLGKRTFSGMGARMSVLKQTPLIKDKHGDVIQMPYDGTLLYLEDADECHFHDFGVEGNKTGTLVFCRTYSTTWERVWISDGGTGMHFDVSQDLFISRCWFQQCAVGLEISGAAFATVSHVNVQRSAIGVLVRGGAKPKNKEIRDNNASHEINGVYAEECLTAVVLGGISGVKVSRVHSRCGIAVHVTDASHCNDIDATCCQGDIVVDDGCFGNRITLRQDNWRCKFRGDETNNEVIWR